MAQEIADSTLLDTWASSGLIVEPDVSKIIEGWQLGEQPPHEYMNWLQNTFGSKLNHILKNGVVKWNDETPYLVGSSVQHNGNVWLCKTTNTNSAPTDSNSNWSKSTSGLTQNITVNVGTGQTYTTINQALEYLSGFYPLHKTTGVTATINLKAGFVMNEQVLVRGLNLGWITIVGEDAETIITHTALTTAFNGGYPAFGVEKGGTSPQIGQLFRFNVEKVGGNKHGLMTNGAGSSANVSVGKGFIGAGAHGITAYDGSIINANGANASNAGANGINANAGATINANGANASNAGSDGIYAARGSTINAQDANASNTGNSGIGANAGATINAQGANASNAGINGINAIYGSTINAQDANASSAGTHGINSGNSSTINAQGANASNAGTHGINSGSGSTINAQDANASNAGTHGIAAFTGSTINASSAIIQNQTTGTSRVRVLDGSHIEATGINTSGGTVPVLSQTANTLTANGIIYQ